MQESMHISDNNLERRFHLVKFLPVVQKILEFPHYPAIVSGTDS